MKKLNKFEDEFDKETDTALEYFLLALVVVSIMILATELI